MEIQIKKLSEIKPYFNNPRDNSKAVAPTMESIKRYGFVKPIVVDMAGVIICGHTRYIAAFQLGLTEVPVVYSDLSEEAAKQFRIADNKLAEKSGFDEQKLLEELKAMKVPEEMQAFFFEDISQLVNFDAQKLMGNTPSTDFMNNDEDVPEDEFGTAPTGDSDGQQIVNGDTVEKVEIPDGSEESSEDIPDTARELYKPFMKDGKKMMKVVCPYCNNIEIIEVK
jgi:hypothetical protein